MHAAWAQREIRSFRLIMFADRQRANPRQMGVGEAGFVAERIEGGLHLGKIALLLHFLRDIEAGLAQARHHVL